ncbi:MAG TPA: enoyl-CoA hydratase-related protein [Terriglobales bacterium]|nr:enoyl-CoA hydratase-related protein [Terriglobales bacterium]
MTYSTLKLEKSDQIATITLTRPEKRNAISSQMIQELLAALDEVESGAGRVVIITGSGKAFCAGMDLDDLGAIAAQSPAENIADSRNMAKMFYRIYSFPKPVISAVNGAAIAGGCGIATLADFTLAVPAAKFGYTEVKIGFIPALVSVFLRRQIGEKHAIDLLLTGRIIDAAEAYKLGMVSEVVPAETLIPRSRAIAEQLIAASPSSIARTKRLLHRYHDEAIRAELELAIHENAEIRGTPDFREGVASFLEKREPKWTGR